MIERRIPVAAARASRRALCMALAVAAAVPAQGVLAQDGPPVSVVPSAPPSGPSSAPAGAPRPEQVATSETASGVTIPAPAAASMASEMYGPPEPKQRHGDLPDVAWPEPPGGVPPALDEAIRIVTKNYPSATAARAALRASAADVRAAKWLRFPSVSANVDYLDSNNSPVPQLVVEAPIWSAGRIGARIRRAQAGEDASSAEYVETVKTLAATTAQTYFQIAALTLREQLLADSVKEHNRLVETMERRVQQEVSPLADLELARSRAAQIEQQYTSTRAQRQTALRIMAELVADPNYDLGPVPFYDPRLELLNTGMLEDQAAAYDPTLRRLRSEADVARADVDATRASIFPQLNAQYSYDDFYKSRVGVSLRAQTSGGLSQFAQVEGARQRVQQALEKARVAEQELRREVASDLIQFDSSREQATISLGAATTASRVSESYMRQFIAGRRSWLDVMNALREAVNAQITRTDAEITVMSTAVKLLIVSGRWRPEFPQNSQSLRD
ncbi:MAG: TolC family protein [Novosphingobium sp.]|nr:TolC family protein [Novosphingobium sp.]